jgi:hypothetical protein
LPGKRIGINERLFKTGDLNLGGKRYADLEVIVFSAKNARAGLDEMMPMFKEAK